MATNVYHGVGVNFGISSSLANVTGLFQTRDHVNTSDVDLVRSGTGDVVEKTYYNLYETGNFDYVASGTGPSGIVAVTLPTVGTLLTITDTVYTAIAGTSWLIDKASSKSSNTTAMKISLDLTRYAGITS